MGDRELEREVLQLFVHQALAVRARIADATLHGLHVLVADRISGAARALLDAAGWGWLDRRGELALRVGDDYLIRSHIVPRLSRGRDHARGPIRSRAGIAYLAAALE